MAEALISETKLHRRSRIPKTNPGYALQRAAQCSQQLSQRPTSATQAHYFLSVTRCNERQYHNHDCVCSSTSTCHANFSRMSMWIVFASLPVWQPPSYYGTLHAIMELHTTHNMLEKLFHV